MTRGNRLDNHEVLTWMQHDGDGTKKVWSITDVERLMQTTRHYARLALEGMAERGWLVEDTETMKNGQIKKTWTLTDMCPRTTHPGGMSPGMRAERRYQSWVDERAAAVKAREQELKDKWFLCGEPSEKTVVTFHLTHDSRLRLPGQGGRTLQPLMLVFTVEDDDVSLDIRGTLIFGDEETVQYDALLNGYFFPAERDRFMVRATEIFSAWEEAKMTVDVEETPGESWVLR